jgi:hypothetical protein
MIALFTKVIPDEILSKLREDSSSGRAPGNKGKHLIVVLVLDFLPPQIKAIWDQRKTRSLEPAG